MKCPQSSDSLPKGFHISVQLKKTTGIDSYIYKLSKTQGNKRDFKEIFHLSLGNKRSRWLDVSKIRSKLMLEFGQQEQIPAF